MSHGLSFEFCLDIAVGLKITKLGDNPLMGFTLFRCVLDILISTLFSPGDFHSTNLAIPLKKLKAEINIQEVTDSFKNCKRFIF